MSTKFPIRHPFETERIQEDEQSSEISIDFMHKVSIAVFLLIYHIGFMLFEYGASRRKSAENTLIRYPLILSISLLVVFVAGFGIAYGDAHLVGTRYYFAIGIFDDAK